MCKCLMFISPKNLGFVTKCTNTVTDNIVVISSNTWYSLNIVNLAGLEQVFHTLVPVQILTYCLDIRVIDF